MSQAYAFLDQDSRSKYDIIDSLKEPIGNVDVVGAQTREKVKTDVSLEDAKAFIESKSTRNYVLFDDKLIKIMDFEQGARGRLTLSEEGNILEILKGADFSTYLHEMSHHYLDMMGKIAQTETSEAFTKDYAVITKWLGVKEGQPFTREQHEKFARGSERYFMEGKAPSTGLRKVFDDFRTYLTEVYGTIEALDVELTDEVRNAMGRLYTAGPISAGKKAPNGKKRIKARTASPERPPQQSSKRGEEPLGMDTKRWDIELDPQGKADSPERTSRQAMQIYIEQSFDVTVRGKATYSWKKGKQGNTPRTRTSLDSETTERLKSYSMK